MEREEIIILRTNSYGLYVYRLKKLFKKNAIAFSEMKRDRVFKENRQTNLY